MNNPYAPFLKNLETMMETHLKKNTDYVGDKGQYFNFEYAAILAEPFTDPVDKVFATMIGIKLARLAVLKDKNIKPKNESIEDTHKDLATYTAIWWTYYNEEVERVKRGRIRTGVRKRERKASSSRGSSSKTRASKPKTTSWTDRKDSFGVVRTSARKQR